MGTTNITQPLQIAMARMKQQSNSDYNRMQNSYKTLEVEKDNQRNISCRLVEIKPSELVARYGDKNRFLQTFHVNNQITYTNDEQRCHFGTAPTLALVSKAYGQQTTEEWLIYQIVDLSEFCKLKSKLTSTQVKQTAQLIMHAYGYLKVTEIMLYFRRFKFGQYGRFYGSVDAMIILDCIKKFCNERRDAIHEQLKRAEEEERERQRRGCISWEEYQRRKKERENATAKDSE